MLRKPINSIRDLAAVVRGRRRDAGLSQAELARRAGVSRQWINEFEAGKPTAELGLVIRLVGSLGLRLTLEDAEDERGPAPGPPGVDLDSFLDDYRDR